MQFHRPPILLAAVAAMLVFGPGGSVSHAEPAEEQEAVARIDVQITRAQVQSIWMRNWRNYAGRVLLMEEGFVFSPRYDPRYPSSRGQTAAELIRESRRGSRTTMPRAEADAAAAALPRLEVGQYGYVQSVRVVEILGPREMVVDQVRLIDPTALSAEMRAERMRLLRQRIDHRQIESRLDAMFGQRRELAERQRDRAWRQRLILRGYPTGDLQERAVWEGPRGGLQIAVVWEAPEPQRFRRQPMIAVRADMFGEGVSREQFVRMLALADHTVESFCALVYHQRQADPEQEFDRVFATLRQDRARAMAQSAAAEAPAQRPRPTPSWAR